MKKIIIGLCVLTSLTSMASILKEKELYTKIIPYNKDSATWESECKMSMKGEIKVNSDKTFELNVRAYSTLNCKKGTDYISFSRTGKFKYQAPGWIKVGAQEYSYSYLSDAQLNLDLSPIKIDSKGVLSSLGEELLSMYQGCVGTTSLQDQNIACMRTGLSKTKSRIRLRNINFITPTIMLGEFKNDVTVVFSLVQE